MSAVLKNQINTLLLADGDIEKFHNTPTPSSNLSQHSHLPHGRDGKSVRLIVVQNDLLKGYDLTTWGGRGCEGVQCLVYSSVGS